MDSETKGTKEAAVSSPDATTTKAGGSATEDITTKLQVKPEDPSIARTEVSASAVGRMMGLATTSDLRLLEGKIDLLSTRISNVLVRLEKAISIVQNAPTGSDLERIDVQMGSLKTMLKEVLSAGSVSTAAADAARTLEGVKKMTQRNAAPAAEPAPAKPTDKVDA